MATLLELADFSVSSDYSTLTKKVRVAILKKAITVSNLATPTAEQIAWAKEAITSPDRFAGVVVNYVVAANATATIAAIISATDAAIETNVGSAIDKILAL